MLKSRDSSVGIGTRKIGWSGLESRRGWEFFSSTPRPDWLWDPPSLLSNG